jgi:hypothetical protein
MLIMDMQEILAVQAAALEALAAALAKRIDNNEITDQWEARRFVEDWTAAVASVRVPSVSKPQPY